MLNIKPFIIKFEQKLTFVSIVQTFCMQSKKLIKFKLKPTNNSNLFIYQNF
jgi:hypothetical protein